MEMKFSNEKQLVADCPECRTRHLVLVTMSIKSESRDFLHCKGCKFSTEIEDFKASLYTN